MENEIDSIDKKIEQLKDMMLVRYDKSVSEVKDLMTRTEEDNLRRLEDKKNSLIKELDDRLALIRQFPSVLEADVVAIKDISSVNQSINIEFRNGSWLPGITLHEGKWKVLILARKVD